LTTAQPRFTPLDAECRTNLSTAEAAFHLNRAQQTLRLWAMREDGPLRPIRVHGVGWAGQWPNFAASFTCRRPHDRPERVFQRPNIRVRPQPSLIHAALTI
jgi:hypothetical protein